MATSNAPANTNGNEPRKRSRHSAQREVAVKFKELADAVEPFLKTFPKDVGSNIRKLIADGRATLKEAWKSLDGFKPSMTIEELEAAINENGKLLIKDPSNMEAVTKQANLMRRLEKKKAETAAPPAPVK